MFMKLVSLHILSECPLSPLQVRGDPANCLQRDGTEIPFDTSDALLNSATWLCTAAKRCVLGYFTEPLRWMD